MNMVDSGGHLLSNHFNLNLVTNLSETTAVTDNDYIIPLNLCSTWLFMYGCVYCCHIIICSGECGSETKPI